MGNPQFHPAPSEPALDEIEGLLAAKPDAFQAFFERWYTPVHGFALVAAPGLADARRLTRTVMRRLVEDMPSAPFADADAVARFVFSIAREEARRQPRI